jgi:CRISPR-associated protein Cas1
MTGRTIEVSSAAHLSLRRRQLVIERAGLAPVTSPLEDLAHLITTNPQITCTNALLAALAEAKVSLVICGADHMPAGVLLPYAANELSGERLRAQLACSKPMAKRLWQSVVSCKLERQGDLLALATGLDAGLHAMAKRVRSGDPDNLEAQGAQRYWPRLLGATFRRDRDAADANRLLNYAYAILRAATARALIGSGLFPAVGLFHSNRGDAFALASDIMEPFRPFADGIVYELAQNGQASVPLDRTLKTHLLAVLNIGVWIDSQTMPLSMALERTAASLAASFNQRRNLLRLPDGAAGLPAPDGLSDDATSPAA